MKKQLLKLVSFLFLFTFVATNYLLSETILISDNIKIIDGDTILLDNKKIRFSGIDAPETKFKGKQQFCLKNKTKINCGKISKNFLTEKIINKKLKCLIEPQKDYFGRYLGECFINNESVSAYMVRNGLAFDYPKYSKKKYSKDQIYAKNNKLGLWSMEFVYPWIWRKNNR